MSAINNLKNIKDMRIYITEPLIKPQKEPCPICEVGYNLDTDGEYGSGITLCYKVNKGWCLMSFNDKLGEEATLIAQINYCPHCGQRLRAKLIP